MNRTRTKTARGAAALATLALLLTASGCVQTRTIALGEQQFAARPPHHPILVFDALDDVERPYIKVGQLRAWGDPLFGDLLEELRAEARKIGADALVLRPAPRYPDCDRDEFEVALAVRWR